MDKATINILQLGKEYADKQWPQPYGKEGSKEWNRWYLKWRKTKEDYQNGLLEMKKVLQS